MQLGAWWHGGYLPHFEDGTSIQVITYRLADALPDHAVRRIQELQREGRHVSADTEAYLDAGHGSCLLADATNAEMVVENWRWFDCKRYLLHAWVVMPNHVHVVIEPLGVCPLSQIVQSWKSYTAKAIRSAGRWPASPTDAGQRPALLSSGRVWQRDYFDTYIRDDGHYQRAFAYVHENPVRAGLVTSPEAWHWSSAHVT